MDCRLDDKIKAMAVSPDVTSTAAETFSYKPPELVSRQVLASGEDAESFGWQLAAAAWQHGFPAAERLAFVADGAHVNRTIQHKHFSHAVPILDLMHALSYAHAASECVNHRCRMNYPEYRRSPLLIPA